jgi:ABC-type Mn2+/Zn2+ transport system permease subunit
MMLWGAAIGSLSVYVGLLISYHFNLAAGASVVVVAVTIFFVIFVVQAIAQALSQRHVPVVVG